MNKYLVEFLGTMFLMYVVLSGAQAFVIGGALSIAILIGGKISLGCFNPAVSCGLYAAGKLSKADLLPYIVAEVLGALAAFYLHNKYIN